MADEKQTRSNNVADSFRGLPIEDLIAAPLKAVCDSQKQLALSAFEFMTQIGFETGANGKLGNPRLLKFDLERSVAGSSDVSRISVNAPFLGLVPIPSLLVNEVNIDFQMEVTSTEVSKDTTSGEFSSEVTGSYGFWFAKGQVKVSGKVSSSRENTRTTNQTAKYQVRVAARQQPPTEGLSKLMDIMASCVEPVTAGGMQRS